MGVLSKTANELHTIEEMRVDLKRDSLKSQLGECASVCVIKILCHGGLEINIAVFWNRQGLVDPYSGIGEWVSRCFVGKLPDEASFPPMQGERYSTQTPSSEECEEVSSQKASFTREDPNNRAWGRGLVKEVVPKKRGGRLVMLGVT